jgi:hypothetical protein
MFKRFLTLVFIFSLPLYASAQDIITKKNGETIKSKVLKVDGDKVEYTDFSETSGPVRTLPMFAISSISYENGSVDFNPSGLYVDGDDLHDMKTKRQFSDDDLRIILSPEDFKQFKEASIVFNDARKSRTVGKYMLIPGAILLGGGLIVAISSYGGDDISDAELSEIRTEGAVVALGGAVLTTIAVIKLSGKGKKMAKANETMRGVAERYNERNFSSVESYAPSVTFGITNNGVGLALRF